MSTLELDEDDLHLVTVPGRKRLQKHSSTAGPAGAWIDEERKNLRAYEYLCHVGEAKEWIEACITDDIGGITDLNETLRDGVILAKLAKFFEPSCVKKIFEDSRLQFRHSDNTNFFFAACKKAGMPDLFMFELTDVYDKKNIPKVIYCLHALSHFLAKRGIAPKIKNLVGQLDFTDEELQKTENSLAEAGVVLPQFGNIEGALAKEMQEETEEEKRQKFLEEHENDIVKCQSVVRGRLARVAYQKRISSFKEHEEFIIKMQSQIRGLLARRAFHDKKQKWLNNEDLIIKLQANIRGYQARKAYREKHDHLHNPASIARIVRLQACFRKKVLQTAYKALICGENIPVKAIKTFIHLLDDSDRDFQEELELENLKQSVIKKIRDNNQTEQLLNDLDIKIALLVRNRITLDEVLKTSKASPKKVSPQSSSNNLNGNQDDLFSSANLKSLDKEKRRRLELYQSMFYILQTQPKYLAKIIFMVKQTKIRNFMDHVLLTLFNFANSSREEFLLLKLFQNCISEEMQTIDEVSEIMKGNPVFVKMVVHYIRGAKERLYLRDLLQPLIKEVIVNDSLDLETDPLVIYRQIINEEEIKTGEASKRPYDVSREQALQDSEVIRILGNHLVQLKVYTEKFLSAIIKNLASMPYGIRYIAKQLLIELKNKFPPASPEDEEKISKVIGNLVYYRYMNPAIVAPEGFDVLEQLVSPLQRKNLAEISKMLQQISVGKLFEGDMIYLSPLNEYVSLSTKKMSDFFNECTQVPDAEDHFEMSDLTELSKTSKPVIYITPQEIFNTHALIHASLDEISTEPNDPLILLIKELGSPISGTVTVDYTGNLKGEVVDDKKDTGNDRGNDISLTLSSRYMENISAGIIGASGSEAINEFKNAFIESKRIVLALIRVQSGKNLREILEKENSEQDEKIYLELRNLESKKVSENENSTPLPESLSALKLKILADVKKLKELYEKIAAVQPDVEKQQKLGIVNVDKETNYQEILTSIGLDIRNKHRRRIQRRAEIKSLNQTVKNLNDKMKYLNDQTASYQDYINSCMAQLTSNRKKQSNQTAKFIMPFSPQWYHMQELKKNGKVPQFGSFKYPADVLYKKGVLVSVDGYGPKQFDKITLIISSDETGVFSIEVSIMGIKLPQKMELKLEDLLQYQFDNQQVIPLFDGAAKVNVNLLIYLINKKFYN